MNNPYWERRRKKEEEEESEEDFNKHTTEVTQ